MAKVSFAFTPYPLQQEIIEYLDGERTNALGRPYRFFVVAFGRQAGKSWVDKYTLLDRAINRNHKCMWIAPTIPTARSHWNDLVKLIRDSGLPDVRISQAAKEISFPGGGEISVRSAMEPDNLRGAGLDFVVLDEAAFFRNGEYVWYSVVMPMITATRGVVLFTSTPNGRNWFWQLFQQGNDPNNTLYKSFHAPSTINPYQDVELLENIRLSVPEYNWREEYMAEFLADSSGVFSGAEAAATVEMLGEPLAGHSYVAGIDFGFNHDASTVTILDKYTGEQVFGLRFFGYGTISTIRRLVEVLHHWQPETTYLEKNGIGETLFELLVKAVKDPEFLERLEYDQTLEGMIKADIQDGEPTEISGQSIWGGRIRAIHMDNSMKRQLVERLSADIEYKRRKLLVAKPGTYGEIQLNEMSVYLRERTASGLEVTYNAPEGAYDDTIAALYLANKAMPRVTMAESMAKKLKAVITKNPFRDKRSRRHIRGGVYA